MRPPVPEAVPIESAHATAGLLRAGAAAVDVTPAGPVWLAGYGFWRRSEGVHDPIYARALVLERGGFELALVALDVVGVQRQDVLRLHERLAAEGFAPNRVLIASTHNHSGPDTIGLWGLPPFVSGRSAGFMRLLEEGVLEALRSARDSLRPAEVAAGSVALDPRGILKNLRRPGLVDPELTVVHLREAGGGPTVATLTALGCHPEVLGGSNRLVTADFPGQLVGRLERALGGVGIHVSGALGGLVTPDVEGGYPEGEGGSFAEAERVGRRLGDEALAVVHARAGYEAAPELAAWHAPLYLRNRNWRYELARWTGLLDRTMHRGGYLATEVNLWEVGDLRLVSVPGEITPDLGLRIKRIVNGRPTLLVGLANDELGYLMPEADFALPIYGYERTLSPGPEAGDRILRRIEDLILLRDAGTPRAAGAQ